MKRKYGNRKTVIDGIHFPSKLEAARYQQLKLLELAGQITGLELQPRFELIPKQRGQTVKQSGPVSTWLTFATRTQPPAKSSSRTPRACVHRTTS